MKLGLSVLKNAGGRYLVVGFSVYLIEVLIIALAQWLGASSIAAVAISFWIGLVISFLLQKFITFGDKRTHRKVLLPQIIAVCILVLFNFGFTLLMTGLLSDVLTAFGARTLALGITTLWNFYLYKTRIFANSTPVPVD